MKIAVRVHDLGKSSAIELAKKTKEIGFDGVQLVLYKAIDGFGGKAHSIEYKDILETAKAFKDNNVLVTMLGAYFNPVHSNKELVADTIERFKDNESNEETPGPGYYDTNKVQYSKTTNFLPKFNYRNENLYMNFKSDLINVNEMNKI
jgi:hypothetical protein